MKGWLFIDPAGTNSKKDFDWWIQTAIEYNKKVTATKPKKNRLPPGSFQNFEWIRIIEC